MSESNAVSVDESEHRLRGEVEYHTEQAMERFREEYAKPEKGDAWLDAEPRFHFWKGIDELFSATHHSKMGNLDDMDAHLQHGLNHLLMASWLAHNPTGT